MLVYPEFGNLGYRDFKTNILLSKPLFPPSRLCVHPSYVLRHKNFFSLKSPWNHSLTLGTPGARSPSGEASKGPKGPF